MTYTYTIFDAHPAVSGPCAWPSHEGIEIEADTDAEALDDMHTVLDVECADLHRADGYHEGYDIYATVWRDGVIVETIFRSLTAEDLD